MKTLIMALVLIAAFVFSAPTVLAQQIPANNPLDLTGQRQTGDATDAGQDNDLLRLGGQIDGLTNQLKGLRSARNWVARAKTGELEARVKALEDARARLPTDLVGMSEVVVMINDAIKAAEGNSASGPGPPVADLNRVAEFNRLAGKVYDELDVKVKEIERLITDLQGRMSAAERKLKRRATGFDIASWASVHRGGEGLGGLGAVVWPLGQDGDWALRSAFGVGQNWTLLDGERYQTIGLLAKADLLYRWDSVSVGPTALVEFGVAPNGLRFTGWLAGGTVRADMASWLFIQASAGAGRARSPLAPLQTGYGGAVEVGIPF